MRTDASKLEDAAAIGFDLHMGGDVHFRLEGKAESLLVSPPANERVTFRRGDVEVVLEPEDDETLDCLVLASTTRQLGDEAYKPFEDNFVELLAKADEPPGDPDASGRRTVSLRRMRWLAHPPEAAVAIAEDVYSELHGEAARLVQLLRWLFNSPSPSQPLGRARLRYSLDGTLWYSAPARPSNPPYFGGIDVELTREGLDTVEEVWSQGAVAEPLARQIFLEGFALADENPRAALVLAVAAVEVGVKQFAAARSSEPSEAWLITEIQSPKLLDLLRDYLPFFTDKRTADGRAVPKALITELTKAATARNDIVHQGDAREPYRDEQLAGVFVAVNDFLYLLDWFAGNDWAFGHLQKTTQEAYPAAG